MAEKKVISTGIKKAVETAIFDTGLKAKATTTITIPGRGRVKVPAPAGNVYVKGGVAGEKPAGTQADWIQITEPLHIEVPAPQGSKRTPTGNNSEWIQFTEPLHIEIPDPGTGSWVGQKGSGNMEWYKFTEPDHIEVPAPSGGGSKVKPVGQFAINGTLTKAQYLYLVRRGCSIKNGILTVPSGSLAEVKKYLKIK